MSFDESSRYPESDFDFKTAEEARKILKDFGRVESVARGPYDNATGSHVIWAMGQVKRQAEYEDGTFQTNAEHICRMSLLGEMLIDFSNRKDVDPGLFNKMVSVHELDEGYVGDTPHNDLEANRTKTIRSAAGKLLVEEFLADNKLLLSAHHEYHDQITPTARFTKAIDCLEAVDFALRTKAKTQKNCGDDFHKWVDRKLRDTVRDHTVFDQTEYLVRQVARKWHIWDCLPFEGDPDTIVDIIKGKLFTDLNNLTGEQPAVPNLN
jgi:5'-deoxynucleotidase YfbR-like HD superfamily hydrolase